MEPRLQIIKNDPYLEPFENAIDARYNYAIAKEQELTGGNQTLAEFASGYLYFGLHKTKTGWTFREYAPNATEIFLIGDFNNWQQGPEYQLQNIGGGVWEINLPSHAMRHGDLYKLMMHWEGGFGERIPAWSTRVVQDDLTKIFSAQVWAPTAYKWKNKRFKPNTQPLLIYECHIGMAGEDEKVSTYSEFRKNVLPRIYKDGYNCIQIMAIQEHPYYGSFGYHVSNFFAASSRFGTPEELKELIDEAHSLGIAVIMDLVHSHAVKNTKEGLGLFDGTPYLYFHDGPRREHPAWDSLCFDYGKGCVLHYLLSNCKFWLEEYHFDGFRFDGVTSMLYYSHGLGEDFTNYGCYYNGNQDGDAICYLTLANKTIHQVNPNAITIAEDMSGMPGLAAPIESGGMGFNYRLAMGIPDFWIKTIKEVQDDKWSVGSIIWELTNHRWDEHTINYTESHDQALVGDKTIIFRLIDADMYWHMSKVAGGTTYMVDRGLALHKMIRLITASTINGGYLNFMGNEFGHPEWIDFPREGNGWSYKYARRQWHLVDDKNLKYHWLGDFDKEMITLIKDIKGFQDYPVYNYWERIDDQVIAYGRKDLLFVFNFSPDRSYTDYGMLVPKGSYKVVLNTDAPEFGGFGQTDDSIIHFTQNPNKGQTRGRKKNESTENTLPEGKEWLMLYLPARSAMVLRKQK
ncbi:MAG: alpha amylase C-terminal domain-containing protein [Paludibacteraceae bacterium]|nr:alpha amylase C-terminal domain-containing protein [Paludibacteraceae bacterium]